MLKVNTALQSLNLEGNNIGAEGVEAIAEAMKSNSTLETLNICNNMK